MRVEELRDSDDSYDGGEGADTSNPLPYNPNKGERPDEEDASEVWYRVTKKNYTETKASEIKCPAVYTITYKE